MTPIEALVSVDTIAPDVLANLARLAWPVMTIGGKKQFVDPFNIKGKNFIWENVPLGEAKKLVKIGKVITFHSFSASVNFTPSPEEVLLQISHPMEQLKAKGKTVTAYEIVYDGRPDKIFHRIEDASTAIEPALPSIERTTYTVHKAETILYSGIVPRDIRDRPIVVGSQRFDRHPT